MTTLEGTPVLPSEKHDKEVIKCAFSPDGKYVVTSSDDQTLKIWNKENGKLIHSLSQDKNWDPNFEISPSSTILATVNKKNVIIFNLQTGENITTLKAHVRDLYNDILFSNNGLFATHSDKEAKLWDTSNWKEVQKFAGHDESIHKIAFSKDGNLFITSSTDTLAVWDVKTGNKIHDLSGPENELKYLEFTNDSKSLIGSLGSEINQWTFNPPEVSSSDAFSTMVQLGLSPVDSSLLVATLGTDNSFVVINMDDFKIRGSALHLFKTVPRFITYNNEIWAYAHNEIVKFIVKEGKVEKENQFSAPLNVSSIARSENKLVCGSPEGNVVFFTVA